MTAITNKDFVLAWLNAVNKKMGVKGLADSLNQKPSSVSAKANNLRKIGVKLPAMPRIRVGYSVEELNRIIDAETKKADRAESTEKVEKPKTVKKAEKSLQTA